MLSAEAVQNLVDVAHVLHPELALIGRRGFGPARFGEGAVHVPLEIADVVFGGEFVEEAEDVLLHIVARHVEHHLRAQFAARAAGEVHDPIGMGAVEIAIGVDHLGFDPEAELHLERVHGIDQALQTLREFLRVDGPIAESGVVVVAFAKPAIVHHEEFHAEFGGLFGERLLAGFVHGEGGGFPGVVEHGAQARSGAAGQNLLAGEAVQHARGRAEAIGGEAAVEGRRVERFAGLQRIGEIEIVEAAGDAHLAIRRLLDGHLPVAAPAQRAEPDRAVFFAGIAAVNGKPRIEIVAGVALAALNHLLAFVDRFVIHLRLAGPTPAEIGELIAIAGRQVPYGGLRGFKCERARGAVADGGGAAENAVFRIHAIMQRHLDRFVDVLQYDVQIVALNMVRGIAQHEVAHGVLTGEFQRGLVVARAAPAGVLFGLQHLVGIEAGNVTAHGRRGQIFEAPEGRAPVEVAKAAIGAHTHRVGALAGGQQPDLAGIRVLNGLSGEAQCEMQ